MCSPNMTNLTSGKLIITTNGITPQKNDLKVESYPPKTIGRCCQIVFPIRSCSIAFNHKSSSIWSFAHFSLVVYGLLLKVEAEVKKKNAQSQLRTQRHIPEAGGCIAGVVAFIQYFTLWLTFKVLEVIFDYFGLFLTIFDGGWRLLRRGKQMSDALCRNYPDRNEGTD